MSGHHGSVTDSTNLHRFYVWEYADATARTAATGFAALDVGKAARQLDDNSVWMLTDDSPITWVQLTGTGATGSYTDEQAQDAVGAMLADTASINLTYTDATPELKADAIFGSSAGTVSEGNHTHGSGGVSDFTEAAQDAVGAMIADTSSINLTYTDATPELKADAIFGTSAGTVAEGNHGHAGVVASASLNFGDGTNVITAANAPAQEFRLPVGCTWTGWYIRETTGVTTGSVVLEVERASSGSPNSFSSIAGTNKPTLSTQQNASNTTLSGWGDASTDAGDTIRVYPSGTPSGVKGVAVHFEFTRAL